VGYDIIKNINFLKVAAEIVLSHQEYYNGMGYPRGLKGKDIPLGARIFSIVDSLDAITSNRSYRPARSYEYARKEIKSYSGQQFDPDLVNVFLWVRKEEWEEIKWRHDGFGFKKEYREEVANSHTRERSTNSQELSPPEIAPS